MIKTLEIRNFKSIQELKLDCRRLNVFIGEPNTGKSNILEALGILSFCYHYTQANLRAFVRFEKTTNLFYDEDLGREIEIRAGEEPLKISFKDGRFWGKWGVAQVMHGDYNGLSIQRREDTFRTFKFYRFAAADSFKGPESDYLLPPSGENLLSLLLARRELRATANRFFSPFGLRLGLRPHEGKIEVVKQLDDVIISYPYSLVSDTLQRLIFYICAVLSNKDSVLVFEEPESHAFPYYTKYLAESIALDKGNNQYFISTHNPYFLMPLLEKSAKEDIAIFIVYFRDYQTKAKALSPKEMEEITEIDVFSNLDRFI